MRSMVAFLISITPLVAASPNVVFIVCDDLGVHDLGCYDRTDHQTPYLDNLATEGMRCTAAYAACPVCSPTRAAIMTGKNPARLHLTTFLPGRGDAPSQKLLHPKIEPQLPLTEVTIAERFKAAGYATAGFGKWHLGLKPTDQGFDLFYAGKANTEPVAGEGGKGEFDLTNRAIDFMSQHKDKPFFVYLAHNAPHIPLAAKRELVEKYAKSYNPVYAAVINTIDTSVGRLLSALDRYDLTKNTIVIFTSDNGGVHVPELKDDAPTHNTPFRAGKGFLYEGGLRVPLIVRYPGVVPAGKTTNVPIVSTDWTLTLMSLCGLQLPALPDGADLSDALKGGKGPDRKLFWHFPHYTNQGSRPGGAIVSGPFKYIEHYDDNNAELYNLMNDKAEMHNLANSLPGVLANFRTELADWRKDVNAQVNEPNPNFDAAAYKLLYLDLDVSKLKIGPTAAKTSEPLRDWRKRIDQAVKK